MPGVKPLRRIQLGAETTAGTAVAATALWRGKGTIQDDSPQKFAEEDIGFLVGVDRTYLPKQAAKIAFDPVEATYEQLPYILTAGIKALTTGVADGVGSGKIYAYPFSTNAANTVKTFTIEGGDDQQEEEMEYSVVTALKLAGKSGEAIMMSGDWIGRQVTPSTFTTQPSTPSVEEILFQKTKLYIDAAGGTIGTTQKTNTLLAFDLDIKTGVTPVWTADGTLYFSFTKIVMPEITLKVTFEHDGTATAEKTAWRAGTARLIRLTATGTTLTTAGTTYIAKTLRIDLPGKWESFDKIGEQDGNDIVVGTFRSRYNATAALGPSVTVVNELTALT
jgi:hypothetical protein